MADVRYAYRIFEDDIVLRGQGKIFHPVEYWSRGDRRWGFHTDPHRVYTESFACTPAEARRLVVAQGGRPEDVR